MKTLIAFLLLAATALAAPPELHLTGPSSARAGKLIILDLDTDADPETIIWGFGSIPEDEILIVGNRVAMTAPAGKHSIFVYAAKYDAATMKNSAARAELTLIVEGVTPIPGPGPGPLPPGPPQPIEKFGLTTWAAQQVQAVPLPARNRKTEIAAAIESVAEEIAAGRFQTLEQMNSRFRAAYVLAMGPELPSWRPFVNDGLIPEFERLRKAGRLPTIADHEGALRELAAGLRK